MSTPRVPDLSFGTGFRSADTPEDRSRWNGNKEVLHGLYIRQQQTLDKVKATMESNYGFPTTLKLCDYEYVLREVFKYRKNLSSDDWRLSIGPRIASRKAAGKRSEVLLNDSKVENIDRRIQRALRSKSSRRSAKAHTAALPHGVVIRTPPASPKLSALPSSSPFCRDAGASDLEQVEELQSFTDFLTGYEAELARLRSSMDFVPASDAGPGEPVLSAQLWRKGCPINEFLDSLNMYRHRFHPADLRLFGPNATLSVLGKICFDFSNNLQDESMSKRDFTLVLDWIGFQADRASLNTFFAQKTLTILATWEALNKTVLFQQHAAALGTLLSVHLTIRNTAPWVEGNPYHQISDYLELAPNLGPKLIKAYPCDPSYLSDELRDAIRHQAPIEVVSMLISAGASLITSVDEFVRYLGCQEYTEVHLAFLQHFLEGSAVVDEPPSPIFDYHCPGGWLGPGDPAYTTDYILLSEGHAAHKEALVSLVCSYSDRQETIVTVPGIFEASRAGHAQLRVYLNAHSIPRNDRDRMEVLEVALSEASERGYADVLQTLIRFGVDPNVRMLPKDAESRNKRGHREPSTWHPVLRAANAGRVEVLQVVVTAPDIDVSLIDEQFRLLHYFDPRRYICPLRFLDDSKLDHILRLLSTLDFSPRTRNDILVYGLVSPHYGSGHCNTDFKFANRLLELGLASTDHDDRDEEIPQDHLLVRAIESGCGLSALKYLVGRDMRILRAISASAISELFKWAAWKRGSSDTHAILEFLAQQAEGFMAHVQEQKSLLLREILQDRELYQECRHIEDGENECGTMGAVKWLLGHGATLGTQDFTNLILHASESFMLGMIESMPDIDAVDKLLVLKGAIYRGWFKLAMALIERGVQINDSHPMQPGGARTILQHACARPAPLWFIKYLVDKGADLNDPPIPDNRQTALQIAVGHGLMNVVELLLNSGADVNALSGRVSNYSTDFTRAIDVAAACARLDMAHFLIKAGARSGRPGLTGFDGAIEMATRLRHLAIVALLRKHAGSGRDERMEAERRWLVANPDACMENGEMKPKSDLRMYGSDMDEETDSELWSADSDSEHSFAEPDPEPWFADDMEWESLP